MLSTTPSELRVFAILISGFQNREFNPVEQGTHVELAGDFVAVMHRLFAALNVEIGTWHHAT